MVARQWIMIDGKISDAVVSFLRNQTGEKLLILKDYVKPRTSKQNKYYHAYKKIISEETGNSPEDLHEYFKLKFLPKEITVLGHTVKIPGTTTRLSTVQFNEFIKNIEIETGVPAPNEEDLYL